MTSAFNFEIAQLGEFLSFFFKQTSVVGKLTIPPFRWVSVSKLESNFIMLRNWKQNNENAKKTLQFERLDRRRTAMCALHQRPHAIG